jgi:hypothetical protein
VRVQLSERERERQIMTIISENLLCFFPKKEKKVLKLSLNPGSGHWFKTLW